MTKILVTGAAGQLGRAVLQHLLQTYAIAPADLVAASRNPVSLADLSAQGIEIRSADFDDENGLVEAFSGVDRLLIISTNELATPGKRLIQHKAAVFAAKKAGVRHVVYTSMPNPDKSLVTFAPDHLGTEEAIKASGLSYTILRNAWYHDNYLMGMPHNLQAGKWYTATGTGRIATISRDDCARAAAAVLADPPIGNRTFTLTGDESLTAEDIAARASAATAKPLDVVHVDGDQLAQGLAGAGLPDFVVKMLVSADANVQAGNFDIVTKDFETLTDVQPQTLADFFDARKANLAG
ncbi:SDR family NAD(P)-dependent oxidoreductase [Neorhizobium lilium]|uniref:SDR family NAD(P)-dependent oxidoreductase n=1 Tax=Neorhizobium lilium TaxID=2503024 RepID=A0A444LHB2_9HYPH|nr:NAD(P)H-binding protein [Neorhizobium lilium]RWX78426.1 SDR family NAD(P)-dependent oxidoreductase [Neorhizobium lilium]